MKHSFLERQQEHILSRRCFSCGSFKSSCLCPPEINSLPNENTQDEEVLPSSLPSEDSKKVQQAVSQKKRNSPPSKKDSKNLPKEKKQRTAIRTTKSSRLPSQSVSQISSPVEGNFRSQDLKNMSVAALRDACKRRGLTPTSTKTGMIRILAKAIKSSPVKKSSTSNTKGRGVRKPKTNTQKKKPTGRKK